MCFIPLVLICYFHFCFLKVFFFFLISLWFLPGDTGCSAACYLISSYCLIFKFSFCFWYLVSKYCSQKRYFIWSQKFLYLLRLVLRTNMRSILEMFHACFEKSVLAALGDNDLHMSLRSIWPKCSSHLMFPYWFSLCVKDPLFKVGHWSFILLLHWYLFLPSDMLIFVQYRGFKVECLCIYNHYILLMNWPLCEYIWSFFVSLQFLTCLLCLI